MQVSRARWPLLTEAGTSLEDDYAGRGALVAVESTVNSGADLSSIQPNMVSTAHRAQPHSFLVYLDTLTSTAAYPLQHVL
jgi:hypothetical protein